MQPDQIIEIEATKFAVMESDNGKIEWISVTNDLNTAMHIAQQREKVLKSEEMVMVIPVLYHKQID